MANFDFQWSRNVQGYAGQLSDIVMLNDFVVAVYRPGNGVNYAFMQGTLDESSQVITWQPSQALYLEDAKDPSFSLFSDSNSTYLLVVYTDAGNGISSAVAPLTNKSESVHLTGVESVTSYGNTPALAACGNEVLCLYEDHKRLKFARGQIDSSETGMVKWQDAKDLTAGHIPTVAMALASDETTVNVVQMHQSSKDNKLYFQAGQLANNDNTSIDWQTGQIATQDGDNPAIALALDAYVQVHASSKSDKNTLYYNSQTLGKAKSDDGDFDSSAFAFGQNQPKIAANATIAIAAFQQGTSFFLEQGTVNTPERTAITSVSFNQPYPDLKPLVDGIGDTIVTHIFSSNMPLVPPSNDQTHVQGIQQFAVGDTLFQVFTSSNEAGDPTFSNGDGFFVIVSDASKSNIALATCDGYGHAGGCQVQGTNLCFPLAAKATAGDDTPKAVRFYDLADPTIPKMLNEVVITEFVDAQAAGFVPTSKGYLVAVLASHSKIYFAEVDENFLMPNDQKWIKCRYNSSSTPDSDLDYTPAFDFMWPQNINLYPSGSNSFYFVGLSSDDSTKTNYIQVANLTITKNGVELADEPIFINDSLQIPYSTFDPDTNGDTNFNGDMRYAGGTWLDMGDGSNPQFSAIAFGRQIQPGEKNEYWTYPSEAES